MYLTVVVDVLFNHHETDMEDMNIDPSLTILEVKSKIFDKGYRCVSSLKDVLLPDMKLYLLDAAYRLERASIVDMLDDDSKTLKDCGAEDGMTLFMSSAVAMKKHGRKVLESRRR